MAVLLPHAHKREAPSGSLPTYNETDVIVLTNQERQENGLLALQHDLKLDAAAQIKAEELVKCGCFQHTMPDGQTAWDLLKDAGYDYQAAGENLAMAYRDAGEMMTAWMTSKGHRLNILNPAFTQIGVGMADNGTFRIVVQMFGDPAPAGSLGKASYYDYVLKSGWSSKGHRVCAVRDWPRKTMLEVTNLDNGATTRCLVTDYGPEEARHPDRIIDLSSTAFADLAPLARGIINVSVREVEQ